MINVPVYLSIDTDDPRIAAEVANAVADNSPQLQDVVADIGDKTIDYSIRLPVDKLSASIEPICLDYQRPNTVSTYVAFPGSRRRR